VTSTNQPIPEDIVALLRDVVTSLEQIVVLVRMQPDSARSWTASEVASQVGTPIQEIEETLAELEARHLLEPLGVGGTKRWRYAPGSQKLAEQVGRLVDLYQRRQLEILRIVSAQAMVRIRCYIARAFADAFVLRRKNG
jgi:hypothetical protein